MDLTPFRVTPTHILVGFVTGGAVVSALGWYQPLVDFGGAGAFVPLSGFGHTLAQGAVQGATTKGILGAIGGGLEATAVGIATAVVLGYFIAVCFRPRG